MSYKKREVLKNRLGKEVCQKPFKGLSHGVKGGWRSVKERFSSQNCTLQEGGKRDETLSKDDCKGTSKQERRI
jgi:hypothetical protein